MLDILVILDRSGSMESAKTDHEGGLRSFVEDQRKAAGDARFTLVQFDDHDPCEIVYDRAALANVKDISLVPRGSTPLLDAIGRAVSHLEAAQQKDASDSTVCMIITDGQENASREWTRARVEARVKGLEAKKWSFLFLGAGIDAFAEAGSLGMRATATANFNNAQPHAVMAMYATTSANMARSRSISAADGSYADVTAALDYADDQRNAMSGTVAPDWASLSKKKK